MKTIVSNDFTGYRATLVTPALPAVSTIKRHISKAKAGDYQSTTITDPEPEPVEYCGGSAAVRFTLPGGRRFVQSYQGRHRNYHHARVFPLRRPRAVRHDRLGRWWDSDEADACNPYGPRVVMNPADYSGIARW